MKGDEFPPLRDRTPPTWGVVARRTAAASFLGAILEAANISTTSKAAQPVPTFVLIGVLTASISIGLRERDWKRLIPPAAIASVLAGVLWLAFNAFGAARWVLVADAIACPMIAVGTAWFL